MFDSLSDRLSKVFRSFRSATTLNEENVKAGLREVRLALLEADVNYKVVGNFVTSVREKCLGQEVIKGVSPAQQVISIVNEELIALLGGETTTLKLEGQIPGVLMLVGLQGSGKTTSAAKIANYLRRSKKKPYLIPADIYRPAAIDQLIVLAKELNMPFYPSTTDMNPVEIACAGIEKAKELGCDVVLIDTAGRLHIDERLMEELSNIKAKVHPQEILFVADAMTGQDAVNVAETFNERLGITGVVLTKMDGDARGGAALSIKTVTGASVKFVGMGEKISELEVFHPDRIAGRILGMGDIVTLVEKSQENIKAEEAEALAKKLKKASFDFDDFLTQMRRIKKIGSISGILKLIPGMGSLVQQIEQLKGLNPEKEVARIEAIINSMTMKERHDPDLINASRKQRIAKGSGHTVQDVNLLLKQFADMRKMMKSLMNGEKPTMPRMPNMPNGYTPPGTGRFRGMPNMAIPPGMIPDMSAMGAGMGMPGMPPSMPAMPSSHSSTKKKKKKKKK